MELLYLIEKIRNPLLDALFGIITLLGDETFFIAAAIVVFWCVSKRLGYFMMCVCFFGTVLNQFFKILFKIPRPWVIDPSFNVVPSAVDAATGYSFPSGHTQNAFGIFGSIGVYSKKKNICIVCFSLACLIGFSRMYLGVHTPYDVLFSVFLALALIFAFYPFFKDGKDIRNTVFWIIIVMVFFSFAFVLYTQLFPFSPDTDPENLFSARKNAYYLFGGVLGMACAYPVEKRFINFETKARLSVQIIKAGVGFCAVLLIKALLKEPLIAILPSENIAHAVRYFVIVFFSVALWPMSFKYIDRIKNRK